MGDWAEASRDRGLAVSESQGERSPSSPYCSNLGRFPQPAEGGDAGAYGRKGNACDRLKK